MGGGVSGFMVIFADPNPTNPCKAAATDKANTLIFLELSTANTHKHPNMAHLLTKIKNKNSNDNDYQLSYYERFGHKLQCLSKIYFTKISCQLIEKVIL